MDVRFVARLIDWKNWKMRSVMVGASLMLVVWGAVAPANGQSPTADFSRLLISECATMPTPPVLGELSHKQVGLLVMAYANQIDSYQSCLHQVAQERRNDLTPAQQTLLAGHLTKAANLLQRLRLDYGDAIRGLRDTAGPGDARNPSMTG
jgi:hypothetical protein